MHTGPHDSNPGDTVSHIAGAEGISRAETVPDTAHADDFRHFIEGVTDILVVGDTQGRVLYANPAAEIKLGYSQAELRSMHLLDFHPQGVREEAADIVARMLEGSTDHCPLPLERLDGSLLPVETRVWLGEWAGRPCLYGISKDLTVEQEALQKFDRAFRLNPTPMAVTDPITGLFDDVNEAFVNCLGYSRDEVVGHTSTELGLFLDPDGHRRAAQGLIETGSMDSIQLQVRRKDGTILEGLFSGVLFESQGRKSVVTVMVDLTQRLATERALARSERMLNGLARAMQTLLADAALRNAHIVDALRLVGEAVGVDRAYVFEHVPDRGQGRGSCSQRYEWSRDTVEPQIDNPDLQDVPWDSAVSRWYDAFQTGDCIAGDVVDFPEDERPALEAQGIISLLALPIFSGGRFWGFVGFDSCMTRRDWETSEIALLRATAGSFGAAIGRKRLHDALEVAIEECSDRAEVSEAKYHKIFETAPIGIATAHGVTGQFLEANPAFCRIVGRTPEELRHTTFRDMTHPDDLQDDDEKMRMLRAGIIPAFGMQKRYLRPDGAEVWVELTVAPEHGVSVGDGHLVGIVEDISQRRADEMARERRARFDAMFADILTDLAGAETDDIDEAIRAALGEFAGFVGVERAFVLISDPEQTAWTLTHRWTAPGVASLLEEGITSPMSTGPWTAAQIFSDNSVRISSLDDFPEHAPADRAFHSAMGTQSLLEVPIKGHHGEIVGAAGLLSTSINVAWDDDTAHLTRLLGSAIANSIERRDAEREMTDAQMSTIYALAKLAESRDDETGKHLARVQDLCRTLARTLCESVPGCDERFVQLVYNASPLHDVGKVGLPDAVLLKPGALTPEEFEIAKTHVTIGADMLSAVLDRHPGNDFITTGIEIARHHHERWDGAGYPDGLSGDEIPLSARIMAVADVYEAMRSHRVYKDAETHEVAVQTIIDGSGTHFDPAVVQAFIDSAEEFERIWQTPS